MSADGRPRGWYHGWNIVAVCILCNMSGIALTMNSFSLFLPGWTTEFKAPISSIALAITLFSIGTAGLSYVIGHCAGRYPARWLFGGGLFLLGLSHIAIAFSTALWQVYLIYTVALPVAIGFSAMIPSQSLVSRWFVRRVGLAMGLTAAGLAVGGIVFPPAVVLLLPTLGWRGIWGGFGIVILLVILPIAMWALRDRPAADDPFGYVTARSGGGAHQAAISFGRIIRRLNFWLILAPFLAVQCISVSTYVAIGPIILKNGGAAPAVGMFLSFYSGAAMAAKLASGWLSDRIGNRVPMTIAAFGAAAGAFLLMIPNVDPAFLIGTAVVSGISGAVWTLLASALLAEFGPASFSRVFGLACALSPVGTLAPPLVARSAELTGSFQGALLVLGCLCGVSALLMLLFFRDQPRHAVLQAAE
ncbi:MFS transporter [Sphingobium sp. Sx8-8]|uniref:MFS transporter n=1 Tax=Sphingobium sp. Sx8-8 TaxID=2933617 RepID=UPI001F591125|nr:MFS transporter [Sphingobium sp. Sx8-8]